MGHYEDTALARFCESATDRDLVDLTLDEVGALISLILMNDECPPERLRKLTYALSEAQPT